MEKKLRQKIYLVSKARLKPRFIKLQFLVSASFVIFVTIVTLNILARKALNALHLFRQFLWNVSFITEIVCRPKKKRKIEIVFSTCLRTCKNSQQNFVWIRWCINRVFLLKRFLDVNKRKDSLETFYFFLFEQLSGQKHGLMEFDSLTVIYYEQMFVFWIVSQIH